MPFFSVPYSGKGQQNIDRRLCPKKGNKIVVSKVVSQKRSNKNALEAPCCSLGTGGALPTGRLNKVGRCAHLGLSLP